MTVNATSWSTTPGSNTTLDSISTAENVMTVAAVNNAIRSLMAGVKEVTDLVMGAKITAGSSNAYTLTTGLGFSAYAGGMGGMFKASFTNTGSATINVDSIGAKTFNKTDGVSALTTLAAGDIISGNVYAWAYQAADDRIILLNPSTLPLGANLTTWSGLAPSSNAQSFVTAADYAAMRVLLGLVIGTNVQAYDADLTTWAGLTPSANAQSLVTAADYATMRTLMGVQAVDAQLFSNIPQNSKSAAYTTVLTDGEKHIFHPSADTTARTWTIDSNANVAYPIGTAITFINQHSAGVITLAITSDTMRLAGAGTTGNRSLAADGVATAVKVASTEWIISGTGLT